jgi:hypothetical protein
VEDVDAADGAVTVRPVLDPTAVSRITTSSSTGKPAIAIDVHTTGYRYPLRG